MTHATTNHQPPPRRLRRARSSERGSLTLATVIFTVSALAAAGLAVDGGRKINALAGARELADNAARVGAQKVDVDAYRTTGVPTLLPDAAAAAANAYLSSNGQTGTVSVDGTTVTVTVAISVPTAFLPGPLTARATGVANAERGVTQAVVGP